MNYRVVIIKCALIKSKIEYKFQRDLNELKKLIHIVSVARLLFTGRL